jgi:hypothetical protein
MDEPTKTPGGVWAVTHDVGYVSLFRARTEQSALRKARAEFGNSHAPYKATKDPEEIDFALAMGAAILD